MVKIIYNYEPNKITKKLINIICSKISHSNLKNNYNFTYHTQKYSLKNIVTKIFYVLYCAKNWRHLGNGWNNIYKHYIKLNKLNFFCDTYLNLLSKYLRKNKRSLKLISIDTTIVYNKYGIDKLKRNAYAKNKKCYKLLTVIDSKRKPIYFSYHTGNINDSKILKNNLNKILELLKDKCKICLADSGFDAKEIRNKFINNKIKPLIPKNIRNIKKDFKMKDLTYQERLDIMFENFKKDERELYKKRIKVENFYANYKQIHRFNMRYDKYYTNFMGFIYIYLSNMLI